MFNFLNKKSKNKVNLSSIGKGELITLEKVNDPVFSNKMMGDGVAVILSDRTVVAPCDGTICLISDTKHAFGIKTAENIEILVHIGLETVNLKGQGFEYFVNVNDSVKKGEPILKVDLDLMKEKGIDLVTPIIVLESDKYKIEKMTEKEVEIDSIVMEIEVL